MSLPLRRAASIASAASTGSHAQDAESDRAPSSAHPSWLRHSPPPMPLPPLASAPRAPPAAANLRASTSSDALRAVSMPYDAALPLPLPLPLSDPAQAMAPRRTLVSPSTAPFSRSTGSLATMVSKTSSISSSPTPSLLPPSPIAPGMPLTPPSASPARQGLAWSTEQPPPLRSSQARSHFSARADRSSTEEPSVWPSDWTTRSAWSGSTHPAQPLDPPDRPQTLRPSSWKASLDCSTAITPARSPQWEGKADQPESNMMLARSPEPIYASVDPSLSKPDHAPSTDELTWLYNAYSSERGSVLSEHAIHSAPPTRLQPSLSPVPSGGSSVPTSSPQLGNRRSLDSGNHQPVWTQMYHQEVDDGSSFREICYEQHPSGNKVVHPSRDTGDTGTFYGVNQLDDRGSSFSTQPGHVRLISHRSSGSTSLHPSLRRLAQSSRQSHSRMPRNESENGNGRPGDQEGHRESPLDGHHAARKTATENFDHVHGSYDGPYISPLAPSTPLSWRHLVRKPVIRQWLYDGKYYGEVHERAVFRSELVFDMAAAGVCHILASEAAEASNGVGIAKFAIVFYLSYSIWADVRSWINQSGSDDVIQRLSVLVYMIVMAGFAANATAVNIIYANTDGCHDETPVNKDLSRRLYEAVYRRGESSSGIEAGLGSCADVQAHIVGGYYFATGYKKSLHAATVFYVWGKAIRMVMLGFYGWRLRAFRRALWIHAACLAVLACIFLSILGADSSHTVIALTMTGLFTDWVLRYALSVATQWLHGRIKRTYKPGHVPSLGLGHVPAINVEHMSERMTLFCLVSIGEVVISSMFTASSNPKDNETGFSRLWGASALAITLAFLISWLTFDVHGSRSYVHPLRRGPLISLACTSLYFPLCGAIVLLGSAVERLIDQSRSRYESSVSSENHLSDRLTSRHISSLGWLLSGSVCVVLACLAAIGCLHKSLDVPHTALISTRVRIAVRGLAAVLAALIPLVTNHDSGKPKALVSVQAQRRFQPTSQELQAETHPLPLLGAQTALLSLLVTFEVVSKIGSVGKSYDPHRAAILHHERMQARARARRTPRIKSALPGLGATARQSLKDGYSRPSPAGGFSAPTTARPSFGHSLRPSLVDVLRPSFSSSRTVTAELEEKHKSQGTGLIRLMTPITPSTSTTHLLPQAGPTGAGMTADWHEYSDLSPAEQGIPDAGAENIGHVYPRTLRTSMRWALLAH